jgi:hypothetical protein
MSRPAYKPAGYYYANGKFKAREYYHRVIMSSPFSRGTQEVLVALCWAASFDGPEVTITKPQIMEFTGAKQMRYVRLSLTKLKEAGMLRTVARQEGGRSVAPIYELRPYGPELDPEPEEEEETPPTTDKNMSETDAMSWEKIRALEAQGKDVPDWLARCVKGYERKRM